MDARGKSLSLAHVIHYCYSAGWFILPVPRGKIGGFITKVSCNRSFKPLEVFSRAMAMKKQVVSRKKRWRQITNNFYLWHFLYHFSLK